MSATAVSQSAKLPGGALGTPLLPLCTGGDPDSLGQRDRLGSLAHSSPVSRQVDFFLSLDE